MVRSLVGFAGFAIVGVIALKVIFSLLGGIVALFFTLLSWAFLGWVFYVLLKIIAPDTARSIREMISGKPA